MAIIYRIVRVMPNGRENILRDILCASLTDTQIERAMAFQEVGLNTGQHIRVYSSQDDGTFLPEFGDLIWDSEVNR